MVIILGKNGNLCEVELAEGCSEKEKAHPIVITGVTEHCALFCLSSSHIALVGLLKDGHGVYMTYYKSDWWLWCTSPVLQWIKDTKVWNVKGCMFKSARVVCFVFFFGGGDPIFNWGY